MKGWTLYFYVLLAMTGAAARRAQPRVKQ
jgi:hypothetical protein